ncbi:MAG: glycine cleavage T C-terminal barrel domain-containing protein, partial [Pseudomonadota bacterium]
GNAVPPPLARAIAAQMIEAAMLSYHADMTLANNPYELGMDRLVDLDVPYDFVSKAALTRIRDTGVAQKFVGLTFDGPPIVGSNDEHWPVHMGDMRVGHVTSAIYSPRLDQNIALAMVKAAHADVGTQVTVDLGHDPRNGQIVPKPFYDPKKTLAAKG